MSQNSALFACGAERGSDGNAGSLKRPTEGPQNRSTRKQRGFAVLGASVLVLQLQIEFTLRRKQCLSTARSMTLTRVAAGFA